MNLSKAAEVPLLVKLLYLLILNFYLQVQNSVFQTHELSVEKPAFNLKPEIPTIGFKIGFETVLSYPFNLINMVTKRFWVLHDRLFVAFTALQYPVL